MPVRFELGKVQALPLGRVIGLDVSTLTGIATIFPNGDTQTFELVLRPQTTYTGRMQRLGTLEKALRELLNGGKPVALVAIEGYAMGTKFMRTEQIELGCLTRYVCWQMKVPVVEIAPTSLKKFATGKGHAQKNMIMMHCLKNWKFEAKSDNVADAYVLARMARCLTGQDTPNAFQARVLAEVERVKVPVKSGTQVQKI